MFEPVGCEIACDLDPHVSLLMFLCAASYSRSSRRSHRLWYRPRCLIRLQPYVGRRPLRPAAREDGKRHLLRQLLSWSQQGSKNTQLFRAPSWQHACRRLRNPRRRRLGISKGVARSSTKACRVERREAETPSPSFPQHPHHPSLNALTILPSTPSPSFPPRPHPPYSRSFEVRDTSLNTRRNSFLNQSLSLPYPPQPLSLHFSPYVLPYLYLTLP